MQEEEQSDEVENLVNDQAFEVCNHATMSQVVKEETEEKDNRAQGTSDRPNLNDCQIVLGGQIFRCLPRENIVDRSEASEKKDKSPLKKLLRRDLEIEAYQQDMVIHSRKKVRKLILLSQKHIVKLSKAQTKHYG